MSDQVLFTIRSETPEEFSQKHSEMAVIATRDWTPLPVFTPPVVIPQVVIPQVVIPPVVAPPKPIEPPERQAWFQIANAVGSPGDTVTVPIFGGCLFPVKGFSIAVSCASKTTYPTSVELGDFLKNYLKGKAPFTELFVYQQGTPEPWWTFVCGFFSISQRTDIQPIPIPHGTELCRVHFSIKSDARLSENREFTMLDRFFSTPGMAHRFDIAYNTEGKPITDVECTSGQLIIK